MIWLRSFFFELSEELAPVIEVLLAIKFFLNCSALSGPSDSKVFCHTKIISFYSG